jgi:hypothetical protein
MKNKVEKSVGVYERPEKSRFARVLVGALIVVVVLVVVAGIVLYS